MDIHRREVPFVRSIVPIAVVIVMAIGGAAEGLIEIDPWAAGDALVAGNTSFALDLYRTLTVEGPEVSAPGNLFFSPYSISSALAMTYAGARGETAQQMENVLQFRLSQDEVPVMFGRLIDGIRCSSCSRPWSQGRLFELSMANSLWLQDGYDVLAGFLDTLAEDYKAPARIADFSGDPDGSRLTINDWVLRETRGTIEDLLSPGDITPSTQMVLANAIYFYAAWSDPFSSERTWDTPFTLLDGEVTIVPTMHGSMIGDYACLDGVEVVDVPFTGGTARMTILLPEHGRLEQIEHSLDAATFAAYIAQLEWAQLEIALPKFRVESKAELSEALMALGMRDAFIPGSADFSGIDGSNELFIGKVIHQAFVDVREEGTEAAAATAVMMRGTGMPPEPITVTIDRPFIFAIREEQTGTILFLGRVVDPRADG